MLRMCLICRAHMAQARPVEGSSVWVLEVSWGGQEKKPSQHADSHLVTEENTPAVL